MSGTQGLEQLQSTLLEYFSTQGLAIDYLQMIHGTWVTGGEGSTLATVALMSMNIAAFGLGIIMFYSTILGGIIKTGLEGDPFGKEWSQDYMAVRLMSGAILMAPVFVEGNVSLIQKMVMFVIVAGSNVADGGFKRVVDASTMEFTGELYEAKYQMLARDIWKGIHCSMAMSEEAQAANYPLMEFDVGLIDATISKLDWVEEGKKTSFIYGLFYDVASGDVTMYGNKFNDRYKEVLEKIDFVDGSTVIKDFDNIQFGNDGECGIFNTAGYQKIKDPDEVPSSGNILYDPNAVKQTVQAHLDTYSNAVKTKLYDYIINTYIPAVINTMAPLTREKTPKLEQEIEKNALSSLGVCLQNKITEETARTIVHACEIIKMEEEFKTKISSILKDKSVTSSLNTAVKVMRDHLVAQGWILAGAWTYQLTRLSSEQQRLIRNTTEYETKSPKKPCPVLEDGESCPVNNRIVIRNHMLNAIADIQGKDKTEAYGTVPETSNEVNETAITHYISGSIIRALKFLGRASLSPNAVATDEGSSLVDGKENVNISQHGMQIIRNPFASTQGSVSPIIELNKLGHGILNVSLIVDILRADIEIIKKTGDAIKNLSWISMIPGGIMEGIATWVGQKLAIWWGLMTGIGYLLAYVLPLLPAIRWLAPAIGWLIQTVEAMAAAPLMVVLLMLPEGQGIMGTRYETLLRYMASNFLRPILDVTALVAAFMLMYAAFGLFNTIFWMGVDLGYNASMFEVMTAIYLYCYLAYHLIDAILKLPLTLSKDVLTLIGGGVNPFGSEAIGGLQVDGGMLQQAGQLGSTTKNKADLENEKRK